MICRIEASETSTEIVARLNAMRIDPAGLTSAWRSKVVGGAGNAPVRRFRHIFIDARFTVGQPEHLPGNVGFGVRIVNEAGYAKFHSAIRIPHSALKMVAGVGITPT
jgi:hypothetical protein